MGKCTKPHKPVNSGTNCIMVSAAWTNHITACNWEFVLRERTANCLN